MTVASSFKVPRDLPPAEFLREPQVLAIIPISRATLWRLVKRGTFPQPCKLSSQVTAWTRQSVLEWCERQPAA